MESSSGGEMPALLKSASMPPEALGRLTVHPLDVVWVCDVGVDVEAVELAGYLVARFVGEVDDADAGVLLGEAPGRLAAYAAGAAGYDRYLSVQPARHPSPPPSPERRS
jgi:hypothetical protein